MYCENCEQLEPDTHEADHFEAMKLEINEGDSVCDNCGLADFKNVPEHDDHDMER